jgi:hypothetical protein
VLSLSASQEPSVIATRSYRVFRSKRTPDLCYAVPEHRPRPEFFKIEDWQYAGLVNDDVSAPPGFAESSARYAVNIQGFYVFRWRGRRSLLLRFTPSTNRHHSR